MNKFIVFIILFSLSINAQILDNMYFLSKDIGWIQTVGDRGIINNTFRTTNGGITWIKLDTQYNYLSIQFVNDSFGYILPYFLKVDGLSYGKNIYKTFNKGEEWEIVNDSLFVSVRFADDFIGYARPRHGDGGLLKTIDGGITWDTVAHDVISSNDWEVVTKDRVIIIYSQLWYKITTDGGISWRDKIFFNKPITSTEFNAIDIKFTDSLNGFVTIETGDYSYGNYNGVCRTTDGGETWTYIKNYMSGGLSMADSLNGIQWKTNKYNLTENGFRTYKLIPSPNPKVKNYFYYSCKAFYACGDSGYFAKSTDCGETWTELPFNVLNPTSVNESTTFINYSLEQNYPNPFNPSTKIKYTISKQGLVTIKIFDVLGNEIMNLVNEEKQAGEYEINFDGSSLSSGIYFYQIQSGEFLVTKKMILMK